jgi:hypothetical protein
VIDFDFRGRGASGADRRDVRQAAAGTDRREQRRWIGMLNLQRSIEDAFFNKAMGFAKQPV